MENLRFFCLFVRCLANHFRSRVWSPARGSLKEFFLVSSDVNYGALGPTGSQLKKLCVDLSCYGDFWVNVEKNILGYQTGPVRETVPLQTSDIGMKTVSVLTHLFLLPERANSVYIISITRLKNCRS